MDSSQYKGMFVSGVQQGDCADINRLGGGGGHLGVWVCPMHIELRKNKVLMKKL